MGRDVLSPGLPEAGASRGQASPARMGIRRERVPTAWRPAGARTRADAHGSPYGSTVRPCSTFFEVNGMPGRKRAEGLVATARRCTWPRTPVLHLPVARSAYSIRAGRRFCTGSRRDSRALPQLVAAAYQVGDLGGVACQLDGFVVRRARLLTAAQPARYFSLPTWVGLGHTAGTGRSSSTSPTSRASAGCILRAPGRPVDLDRYALRVGSRVD
jgi:hypothetical protein